MSQQINSKDDKALISLTEAVKYCNYSQEYLSLRARSKKLKSVKVGRNWMTTVGWLNEYLQRVEEYKDQISSSKPVENLVEGATVVFADENAGEPVPSDEPMIDMPVSEPQPTETTPEETVPVELPQENLPLETPIMPEPEPQPLPPIESPTETTENTEATTVSFTKEIAPPQNLPSEDELLKKYVPYEYPTQEGLKFGYVAALTVVMVLAGFTLGGQSLGIFFSDVKEYGSLVFSGSHTIGTDLARYSSYSLSYSGQIFVQYINWLSSLFF